MRILLVDRLHVMEVGGAQQCAGVKHAAQSWAVLLLPGAACLQRVVRHQAVDSNQNLWLGVLGGKDPNVLMESDLVTANDAGGHSHEG